jgi:hypothetical protein
MRTSAGVDIAVAVSSEVQVLRNERLQEVLREQVASDQSAPES